MKQRLLTSFIFIFIFSFLFTACCRQNDAGIMENDDNILQYEEEVPLNGEQAETLNPHEETPQESTIEVPEESEIDSEFTVNTITYIRAKVDGLAVRTGADPSYSTIGSLDKGDMVLFVGKKEKWFETIYKGNKAFVSANEAYTELFEIEKSDEYTEKVIEIGTELLGTNYVFGAVRLHNGNGKINKDFDINKFDCSSFMQYMFYYGANKNLALTTRTQVMQGDNIDRSEIKRGDLLFYTNSSRYTNVGTERIGHVALYLGNGYILHTASDHAVIEKISAKREGYFICARRMI